jgi:hypothetical protein
MKPLSLAVACILLVFLQTSSPRAEPNSGTWDIGEFDSCFGMGPDEHEKYFGGDMQKLWEHYRYCCYMSGGEWAGDKCVAPSSSSSSSARGEMSVRDMEDRPTSDRLQDICRIAAGAFGNLPHDTGYVCTKGDCDTKGGDCTVACNNDRRCIAVTPEPLSSPVSVLGILQNGDNINREKETSGGSSPGSSSSDEPSSSDDSSSADDWPDGHIL